MACPERFADIANAMAELPDDMTEREQAYACVHEVLDLSQDVGIPANLTELNVPQNSIPEMAQKAMGVARPIENNPRKVCAEDLEAIYREAFGE